MSKYISFDIMKISQAVVRGSIWNSQSLFHCFTFSTKIRSSGVFSFLQYKMPAPDRRRARNSSRVD